MRLLSAVKSEIEGIIGDHEGIYCNVSLLLEDRGDYLSVVCRSNQDRPLAQYRKSDLLISDVLVSGEIHYEPDCNFADKPYKAIFALPLVSAPEGSKMFTNGIVSIDSSQAHCFDGLEEEVVTKTLVYINLLKLVIISDGALRPSRGRQNASKS